MPRDVHALPWFSLFIVLGLQQACSKPKEPIQIGVLGPLHSADGEPMHYAAILAQEEINRSGGIRGRPVELVERDDYGSPDSALLAAADLQRSQVVAVIGSIYSSVTIAVAPVFNGDRDPVPQITPSSSSPSVTGAGPYTFRLCPSDLAHGTSLARYAREVLHYSRAAVLYQNDEYGRGIRASFVEEFIRLGGQVVEMDPYLLDAPLPTPYMERLARRDRPDFVFVAGLASAGIEAIHQARSLGFAAPFMGGDGLSNLPETDPATEGTFISVAYHEELPTPRNLEFVQAYHDRFPSEGAVNQSGAGTYEALFLLRDAIARVGTDRRKVRNAIAGVGTLTPAFEGLTGRIAFDANGDVPSLAVVVGVFLHGTLRPVPQ